MNPLTQKKEVEIYLMECFKLQESSLLLDAASHSYRFRWLYLPLPVPAGKLDQDPAAVVCYDGRERRLICIEYLYQCFPIRIQL